MPDDDTTSPRDGSEDQKRSQKRQKKNAAPRKASAPKSSKGRKAKQARPKNGVQPGTSDSLQLLQVHRTELRDFIDALRPFSPGPDAMRRVRSLYTSWNKYAVLSNEIVLPAFEDASVETDTVDEALIEHDLVSILMGDLIERDPNDDLFGAELRVLGRLMKAILDRDDQKSRGLFAKAKGTALDLESLRQKLHAAMSEAWFKAEEMNTDLMPRHLRGLGMFNESKESQFMRGQGRDRDEYGRFISDDERGGAHRGSRSMRGGGYEDDRRSSSRSRSRDDDDYRGGNQRSSAGRGRNQDYNDERGYESRGRGRSEDFGTSSRGGRRTGGWFGDSEGHSEAARRGWDNPSHGDSGWFGDSEGHSEASRRGWRNPDHGDSGWFGDSEGHSRASRRGWDNPDHGESGWFGDSEGHSEASRRGWEGRRRDDDDYGRRGGGSRSSGGGRGRSRGYDYDD